MNISLTSNVNRVSPRPRIAVLLGDANGVGPEMAVKLLAHAANLDQADVLLIADPAVLAAGEQVVGVKLTFQDSRIEKLTYDVMQGTAAQPGVASALVGATALRSLELATQAVLKGTVQGIVFAPLNKHNLRLGGMHHEDELRYMQEQLAVSSAVCEFNITGNLWTSRVSSHVPLRDVAALVTVPSVRQAVLIIHHALHQAGISAPRIAVTGLNPHAGDGGSIGMEEIEVIAPAIASLQLEGIDARGPFSPDTVFIAARRGDYDAVVSMYHDQGQIAMKLLGFERGVTLHGGLPVPVATPASGSAFDIAGQGIARVDGLQAAFDLCVKMAKRSCSSEP